MPDSFLDMARAIVDSHTIENDEHADEVLDRASLIEEFASALRSAATVPEGHVRQGTKDMPLLGTLPVTADNCVAGIGCELWADFNSPGIDAPCQCTGPGWPCVPMSRLYGRRAVAEAARAGRAP